MKKGKFRDDMEENSMIYQLKAQLKDIRPPVWRRLLVPSEMTFAELHRVLQKAFDWEDRHLHTFYITKTRGTAKQRIEIGNDGGAGWSDADYEEHKERIFDWLVEEEIAACIFMTSAITGSMRSCLKK